MFIAGALATLDAIEKVTGEPLQLEFQGTKAVWAFDTLVVTVVIRGQAKDQQIQPAKLLRRAGRGRGILAILNATNRIIGAIR